MIVKPQLEWKLNSSRSVSLNMNDTYVCILIMIPAMERMLAMMCIIAQLACHSLHNGVDMWAC